MPKGNPISLAEVSAILGVKKTSEIIPLCHPLSIDHISTKIILDDKTFSLDVFCVVSTFSKTGVEMEALTAVSVAALTVYDMCKSVDRGMRISDVRLVQKSGGKSGTFEAS